MPARAHFNLPMNLTIGVTVYENLANLMRLQWHIFQKLIFLGNNYTFHTKIEVEREISVQTRFRLNVC